MISHTELEQLRNLKNDALADLQDIHIDATSPIAERLSAFLAMVKNPYHFRYGNVPVSISFVADGEPLEKLLVEHFAKLKR